MMVEPTQLPGLPLELQHHILRFCDPQTLARASRVSLASLELASPLLYTHVVIRTAMDLSLLFSTTSVSTAISPYLSLDRMRTLEIHEGDTTYDEVQPAFDRVPGGPPLLLDKLTLVIRSTAKERKMVESVLSCVTPMTLHVKGDLSGPEDPKIGPQPPVLSLDDLRCNRLQSLHVQDAVVDTILAELPVADLDLSVCVTSQLGPKGWALLAQTLLVDIALPSRTTDQNDGDFLCAGMTVNISVDTQERKLDLLEMIKTRALTDMDEVTLDRRLARIHIAVSAP